MISSSTIDAILDDCMAEGQLPALSLAYSAVTTDDKGKYVCTGPVADNRDKHYRIGKLVQIRKGAGVCGTDVVFLRHADNKLITHENQSFWFIPKTYHKQLDDAFMETEVDDADVDAYRDCEGISKLGFIVEETEINKERLLDDLHDKEKKMAKAILNNTNIKLKGFD